MTKAQDLLRWRFAEACRERDVIVDTAAPLRRQRDEILAKALAQTAKAEPLTQRIRETEAPLYNLHNEIATISRALGGKTSMDGV